MINQTSFVDVSVVGTTTTTTIIGSTTSIPLLEASTTMLTPTSETLLETEESSHSSFPSNPPSMFSTSMAPPRPTPSGQEEELITTVAPTIKEEHDDTDVTDLETQNKTESSDTTEPISEPVGESDDDQIEISTIQPDVPMPDTSVRTEPMFVEGQTDETIMDAGITAMESNELTSNEVFTSPEPTFTDYDEIQTGIGVEGIPPQEGLSSSPLDSTTVPTASPTDTTFMCNTQPGREVEITSKGPPETSQTQDLTDQTDKKEKTESLRVTATPVLIISETSAEYVTSSISVIDESTIQIQENSSDTLSEDDTTAEIGAEFFTSPPMASSVADMKTPPGTVVSNQSTTVTADMPLQRLSGKTYKQTLNFEALLDNLIFSQQISNLNVSEQEIYIV